MQTDLLKSLALKERRFAIEPEIAIKLIRLNKARTTPLRIVETGVQYSPRTYEEGKKIGWLDALAAIKSVIKYKYFSS